MERLRRTFTLRKKKPVTLLDKSSKPPQWNDDERKVREGSCSFQVKYLGSIEVFESRGMPVCEEAMKQLLKYKLKKKAKRAVLYVSGDALRVTEEISKGLIVDQVIEKVSFCAPDRNHLRGFAYICRDAATRRWLCHGFKAVKESGERLSHAVGCAFAVCLERKQQREKDSVDVTFNESKTSFTRLGSFKQATITERLQDPQSVIIPEAVPSSTISTPKSRYDQSSIPRPHACQSVLDRQSSLRIFPKLQDQQKNPFKRDYSVRITDLSSNQDRKQQIWHNTDAIKEEVNDVKEETSIKNFQVDSKVSPSNIKHIINPNSHKVVNKPTSDFSHLFGDDPFSAAPINPAAHIKHNNNQGITQDKFNNSNLLQHSHRTPETEKSYNRPSQTNSKDVFNNNNNTHKHQHNIFNNNNGSTSWSEDILKPATKSSDRTARNIELCANINHNPFDVSWVNHTTLSSNNNINTNPFKC